MEFHAYSSPHSARPNSVTRIMLQVILALLPGIAAMIWYFGWGLLINIVLAVSSALGFEALVLKLRQRPILPTLRDLSAVVTALLFAIAVPPLLPWWLTLLGMAFAIILVKQFYGGLGYNPFNPAMAAYVLLLISYPVQMTSWLPPSMLTPHHLDFMQTLSLIFGGAPPQGLTWDSITMATPLGDMRTHLHMDQMISEIKQSPVWGDFGGLGWEWVGNWFLLGGLWLIYKRTISWQIPFSFLSGLIVIASVFWLFDPERYPFPLFHVFSGAAILGAFFIATDPVSASTTPRGQLIYGAAIGVLVYVIRTWGGYPDGVAFAVLLLNMAAPTIDYYTQPRTFGHGDTSP